MEMNMSQQSSQCSSSQKYTTVGSVWHPQTTPMQPPMRRGRTLRSVAPDSLDHNPSIVTHHPAQYYSPLQQNFDRAVSPLPPDRQLFARIAELEENHSSYSTTMSQQSSNLYQPSNELVLAGKQDENTKHYDGDDGSDSDNDEEMKFNYLNRMPTKSVTNLASYSNPMQKAAQKLLTRARQAPSSLQYQKSDTTQENRGLLPPPGFGAGLKYNRSDPLGAEGLLQSDRVNESGLPNRPLASFNPNISDYTSRERDSYPAVLSKGHGAPLPLTAGPPGQRQFLSSSSNSTNAFQKGTSAFSSSTGHWQKGFDQPRIAESFEDVVPRSQQYPSAFFQPPLVPQPMNRQPTPSLLSRAPSAQQYPAMNKGRENSGSSKMVDTLTYEEARKFFPNGFPADFNNNYHPIPDNWAELRLQELAQQEKSKNPIALQGTHQWQATHQANLHRDFYSGNAMINQDFDMAVHEKNSRDVARAVGSTFQEGEKTAGRVDNRQLSIDEINEIPTYEHAKPLLSVMYQSLANHPDITPNPRLPKYVVPPKKKKSEDSTEHHGSR
ncbi:uncharacterized protein GGS22DRAFT_126062 [Annulohypoxylon maeteangense]|uniref:uncharacterized protein n=1 Tax=Annulohypoxylon maeteangense TaxID=1927788 RepID=UPI002008A42A|nr:uncharacterized protein GGS22DRAFT_126062 [Annulohypoxylon maeteangense]KAI0886220.1 hypothetical protein GGS22DRAFT_126062 [Annulohypoxylon maeteangense]